jgi:hypothetical protein
MLLATDDIANFIPSSTKETFGGEGVRTNKATLPSVYLITNTLRVYRKLCTRYRGVQSCILNVTEMNTV